MVIDSSGHTSERGLWQAYKDIEKSVLRFIEQMRIPGSPGLYRISKSNPPDLYACTYVPQILALLGRLDWLSGAQKRALVRQLQSYQSEDGYFKDNLSDSWGPHRREMNVLLMSALACSSLALLDSVPLRKMRFLDKVMMSAGMRAWYDERRCAELMRGASWNESIATQSLAICLLLHAYHAGIDVSRWEVMDAYFDCLESLQDERTGFWGTRMSLARRLACRVSDVVNAMRRGRARRGLKGLLSARAGAPSYQVSGMGTTFHMVDIYAAVGRRPRHANKIARNTVKCQQPDGLFNPQGGGSQCHDLDAIAMLANLYHHVPEGTQRHIRDTMTRTLEAFVRLELENADGGFRNRAGGEPYQNVDTPVYIKARESDLLSTWFRLAAIAYIDLTVNLKARNYLRDWHLPRTGFLHHDRR